ncbi:hypothetical protein [Streptosporangium sp. NPDC049644]|uniref:hypothetical protein n=1 Tax=Streptosporangium sp. NPDC049644 TaxID=3155507 RepID=UPI00342EC154
MLAVPLPWASLLDGPSPPMPPTHAALPELSAPGYDRRLPSGGLPRPYDESDPDSAGLA